MNLGFSQGTPRSDSNGIGRIHNVSAQQNTCPVAMRLWRHCTNDVTTGAGTARQATLSAASRLCPSHASTGKQFQEGVDLVAATTFRLSFAIKPQ